jgi:hypothetical protein
VPQQLSAALDRPDFQVSIFENEFEALARVCTVERSQERAAVLLLVEPAKLRSPAEVAELIERLAPSAALWVFEATATPQLRAATPADRAAWPAAQPLPEAVGFGSSTPDSLSRGRSGPRLDPATKRIADDAVSTTKLKLPSAPRLRLAGEGPVPEAVASPAHQELKVRPTEPQSAQSPQSPAITPEAAPDFPAVPSGRSGHLLSDEELAMLLATDPDTGHD